MQTADNGTQPTGSAGAMLSSAGGYERRLKTDASAREEWNAVAA